MDLGISGLVSGFDWRSLVDQLSEVERAPQRQLRTDQDTLEKRNIAYGSIITQMGVLKNRVDALKDPTLFDARLPKVGDSTVASATAAASAALGSYTFNITQLATASSQQGAANAGLALNPNNNVTGLVLSAAAFANVVTAGTFTVNGKQVTIETSDTLQGVFDKISTATGGSVSGSYNNATDKITFSSASPIILGSATDTSNFLQSAKLYNNGTGTVASSYALGTVKKSSTLATSNFATAISDGGSGAGKFKINGVTIEFNSTTDTVSDVLDRITNSTAEVTASYDSVNDRFVLTNKSTGDLGIALEDITGNFLAATQLSSGTLSRGKNLLYTVNGGGELTSQSNTIAGDSSGLAGLSVTALKLGETTVEVSSDTAKIKTAITDFIAEYNKSQSLIDTQTASTTDAKGKVTAGVLASEREANEIASKLRGMVNSVVSGLSGTVTQLASLGINSNGTDDTIALADSEKLEEALASHLSAVKNLFADEDNGLAVQLSSYLEGTSGEEGSLVTKQSNLTKQSSDIDTQIEDLERFVVANQQRLIESFIAMERAQARINQQSQFLAQRFGTS